MGIKPQDILVLLKIIACGDRKWNQSELADELRLSRAEISYSLNRCMEVGLIDSDKREPRRSALLDFITSGIRFVFPAKPGSIVRGIATSHSAAPLNKKIISEPLDTFVWPSAKGTVKGQEIEPLYPTVPEAIQNAPKLYELLALVDAMRVGRTRELKLAEEELRKRLRERAR